MRRRFARFDMRSTWASTGSTPHRSTAGVAPRRSSPARSKDAVARSSCSPSAGRSRLRPALAWISVPGSVRADLEASLRRLRTDRVDLLQIHDVDPSTPIEETWGELQRLVDEGKVRHCGISNHPVDLIERALAVGPVGALQYQYSLLHRLHERDVISIRTQARDRRAHLVTARGGLRRRRLRSRLARRRRLPANPPFRVARPQPAQVDAPLDRCAEPTQRGAGCSCLGLESTGGRGCDRRDQGRRGGGSASRRG